MKVCRCGSVALDAHKDGTATCRRCGTTGRFPHLHQQTGAPHKDRRNYLGSGGSYKPVRKTDPQS